jgi:hypothetical protein
LPENPTRQALTAIPARAFKMGLIFACLLMKMIIKSTKSVVMTQIEFINAILPNTV